MGEGEGEGERKREKRERKEIAKMGKEMNYLVLCECEINKKQLGKKK